MCIKIDFADQPDGLNMVDVFAELEALPGKRCGLSGNLQRASQESYDVTEGDNVILYLVTIRINRGTHSVLLRKRFIQEAK